MIDQGAASRVQFTPLIATALMLSLFYCAAFFPGTLPFDSAYQWWQARGGETSNVHGVGMTLLWRLSNALMPGTAPLFVLQLSLLWCGLVLIAASLPQRLGWRLGLLLASAFAPVVFVLFSSVVSDAVLAGLMCCALGICLCSHRRADGHGPFLLAMVLLSLAVVVRKNALLAVFPLVVFATHREFFAAQNLRPRSVLVSLCIVSAMYGSSVLLDRTVDRRVTVFATTAMWDLAAVSIGADEQLLPPATHGPELDVGDLRQAFVPYSAASIFAQTRASVAQPFFDANDPVNDAVWGSWIAAIIAHPQMYLAHRWRVTRGLFGSKDPAWPSELVYFPGNTQYRDNPPVAINNSRLHAWFMARFEAARASQLVAPWPYLLLAVAGGLVAWRRRAASSAQAALAVIASGLCYAAPLPIIAPSVELRYLGWMCLSAVIGAALAFSPAKGD